MKYAANFERNQAEAYAENFWKKNGFEFEVKRKSMSKCVYTIRKDGLEFPYTIPCDVTDVKAYMQSFAEQYEMRKEIASLQKGEQPKETKTTEFNPFDISAADTKKGLLDNYRDRRKNSLRLASGILADFHRHEIRNASQKLAAAANVGYSDALRVTPSDIDEMIVQLTQARRHIADVDKCDAVIQALDQIDV